MQSGSPSSIILEVVERLSLATELDALTRVVAEAARKLTGADGATFVLRDQGLCFYADEDAIAPLWKGHRFPMESCISGWSMLHREVAVIRDIYQDPRIPVSAYRPTFVKSLCMVPIRSASPIGAIGNYWAREHAPTDEEIKRLQVLADSTAVALENLELRQAMRRREAEHQKLEISLHSLAHDLKSPLATMMGLIELTQLQAGDSLDGGAREYMEAACKTGEQMCRQIDRLLEIYRLADCKLRLERVDLSAMARELGEQLRVQHPGRQVAIDVEAGLWAQADPSLLRLALENLLANAFKYTSRKPSARIQFGRKDGVDGAPTFFVRDNGAGFDPAQADGLFKPLVRLHKNTEFPGTGLGLASVARVVELHGGRVSAEGRPSEGATFYFSLPA